MNELEKAYFELYKIILEKANFEYEIDSDVLKTLDKLKKEVNIIKHPFFVSKLLKCSICGENIVRRINIKNPVCFNCKTNRQREKNLLYSARSYGQKIGD